jgi:serine/threonine protein kinase
VLVRGRPAGLSRGETAEDLFHRAVATVTPEARDAVLASAGPSERARVESLLSAHNASAGFFRISPDAPAVGEAAGTQVGRYHLTQQVGEGGFAVVFAAEQSAPVRRTVALKIIKPGMDSRQVIARFDAERQALAMMDHPHIAKVFDAGTTDSGRPYFVMELVSEGTSITAYCDNHRLSVPARLARFADVCAAVHHAHQKGVIHRDLKPSNVLVTVVDGEPVVKVIDFGIAKATTSSLIGQTLFTEFGQLVARRSTCPPSKLTAAPATSTHGRTCTRWACCCTSCWSAGRRSTRASCGRWRSGRSSA